MMSSISSSNANFSSPREKSRERRDRDDSSQRRKKYRLERENVDVIGAYHKLDISSIDGNRYPKDREHIARFMEHITGATKIVNATRLREKHVYVREVKESQDKILLQFKEAVRRDPFALELQERMNSTSAIHFPENFESNSSELSYLWGVDGVAKLFKNGVEFKRSIQMPYEEFVRDLECLNKTIINDGHVRTFSNRRLKILEQKYVFHQLLNYEFEHRDSNSDTSDFNTITKVDNHIHAAACMTRMELLDLIRLKAEIDKDRAVVADPVTKTTKTLKEALKECGIDNVNEVSTEKLGCASNDSMWHRFDLFNESYKFFDSENMRGIFLKSENLIKGEYFAELLKGAIQRICDSTTTESFEPRLSIYGNSRNEWKELATFFIRYKLLEERPEDVGKKVKWMIQIPRVTQLGMGKKYQTFDECMRNIFEPIFEATLKPQEHPEIHTFLSHIGGFDTVDDESINDSLIQEPSCLPKDYKLPKNPPYSYFSYYLAANIKALNVLREKVHLNTFPFKPHCGEAGQKHHLATSYLLADSVNHGIKLDLCPPLCYLYFISQIGLATAPLSNDVLFVKIKDSPIGRFHRIGLKISINTDDPLQFHNTESPFEEEYMISRKMFDFNNIDMSEIAKNSVLISSFDHDVKKEWLGDYYEFKCMLRANNPNKSNVTNIRCAFRQTNLVDELAYLLLQEGEFKKEERQKLSNFSSSSSAAGGGGGGGVPVGISSSSSSNLSSSSSSSSMIIAGASETDDLAENYEGESPQFIAGQWVFDGRESHSKWNLTWEPTFASKGKVLHAKNGDIKPETLVRIDSSSSEYIMMESMSSFLESPRFSGTSSSLSLGPGTISIDNGSNCDNNNNSNNSNNNNNIVLVGNDRFISDQSMQSLYSDRDTTGTSSSYSCDPSNYEEEEETDNNE